MLRNPKLAMYQERTLHKGGIQFLQENRETYVTELKLLMQSCEFGQLCDFK